MQPGPESLSLEGPTEPTLRITDLIRGHWGAILAGALAGFGVAIAMATLGAALGMSATAATVGSQTDPETAAKGLGAGAIAWLLLSAIVTGAVGGTVMRRLSREPTYRPKLFGFVNWALGVTIAALVATSGGSALAAGLAGGGGAAMAARGPSISATDGVLPVSFQDDRNQAGQGTDGNGTAAGTTRTQAEATAIADRAAKTASALAWTSFAALLLGLIATVMAAAARTTRDRAPHVAPSPA